MPSHPVLAVRCRRDLLLHHLAPIGLAAAAKTALLIDLDESAPPYPGRLTVEKLIRDGARRSDLGPAHEGVALLARGAVELDDALGLVEVMAEGWPALVLRVGESQVPYPVIEVAPELPSAMPPACDVEVLQPVMRWSGRRVDAAIRLPVLRRGQVRSMLAGHVQPRWGWIRAWRQVWERSWG